MKPVLTKATYSSTCRKCKFVALYEIKLKTDDFEFFELGVHSDLDDRGWVDGCCPPCVEGLDTAKLLSNREKIAASGDYPESPDTNTQPTR